MTNITLKILGTKQSKDKLKDTLTITKKNVHAAIKKTGRNGKHLDTLTDLFIKRGADWARQTGRLADVILSLEKKGLIEIKDDRCYDYEAKNDEVLESAN